MFIVTATSPVVKGTGYITGSGDDLGTTSELTLATQFATPGEAQAAIRDLRAQVGPMFEVVIHPDFEVVEATK